MTKLRVTGALRARLRRALKEDLGRGDITSRLTVPSGVSGAAQITAKAGGIAAGTQIAREIFRLADRRLHVKISKKDGSRLRPGVRIMTIEGRLRSILAAERVALNFLGHLSGVATETHLLVSRVKGTGVKIFDTRKTTPLWRDLEKYAVRVGGGHNHRMSLSGAIMVKDTHWIALGRRKLSLGRRRPFTTIEIETTSQLKRALSEKPDLILIDNTSPVVLGRYVRFIKAWAVRTGSRAPRIEASGGVHTGTVRRIARTGVNCISVGSITHSAPAVDMSLRIVRVF